MWPIHVAFYSVAEKNVIMASQENIRSLHCMESYVEPRFTCMCAHVRVWYRSLK